MRVTAVAQLTRMLRQGRPALFGMVLCSDARSAGSLVRAAKVATDRPSTASGQEAPTFGGRLLRRP